MYEEITVQDLIDLLNNRQAFRKSQEDGEGLAPQRIDAEYFRGAKSELSYLLGRITAHKCGIRSIRSTD
jgi:hypothetical protein